MNTGTTSSKMNGSSAQAKAKAATSSILDRVPEVVDTATEIGRSFLDSFKGSKDKALSIAVSTLKSVEKSVKENPYLYIGGAACAGFVSGYIFAHRRGTWKQLATDVKDRVQDATHTNLQ